jgi:hypothetical protein
MARVELMIEAIDGESLRKVKECLSASGLSFEIT